jgi:hypothetical protein
MMRGRMKGSFFNDTDSAWVFSDDADPDHTFDLPEQVIIGQGPEKNYWPLILGAAAFAGVLLLIRGRE